MLVGNKRSYVLTRTISFLSTCRCINKSVNGYRFITPLQKTTTKKEMTIHEMDAAKICVQQNI